MGQVEREKEQLRRAKIRLRRIEHYEQVTKNVSQTCRFFGISRHALFVERDSRERRPPRRSDVVTELLGGFPALSIALEGGIR